MVYKLYLHAGRTARRQVGNLLFKCMEMLGIVGEVYILHVFCEANRVADRLASYSLSLSMSFHECEEASNELYRLFFLGMERLCHSSGGLSVFWVGPHCIEKKKFP